MHPSPRLSIVWATAAAVLLAVVTLGPVAAAPPRDARHALQVLSDILDGDSSAGAEGGGGAASSSSSLGGDLGDTDEELGDLVGGLVGELGGMGAGLPPPRASRDLAGGELEPVSSGVWLRLFNDFVSNQRRFKGRTKKGPGKGCFGGKLDRIGALSGLGC
ncbi:uncharacterized protein LOC116946871 [Petromyzon marinus]|uniref:uncharacterized protein LOC116946871 n=1 Tax=Petromyzon marinus TaxID=7757 RepID=UPI003F702F0B